MIVLIAGVADNLPFKDRLGLNFIRKDRVSDCLMEESSLPPILLIRYAYNRYMPVRRKAKLAAVISL